MIKIIISLFLLFFLAITQTSFLIHLDVYGVTLNLVLIFVVLFNFFEEPRKINGLVVAVIGGFYLDLFSDLQIGASLFTLVILAFFIKRALKTLKEKNILYFIPALILAFVFFGILSTLFNSVLGLSFPVVCLNKLKVLEIGYNLLVGIIGFYLIKLCFGRVFKK